MTAFCPSCGTPRIGTLRYCGSCQFDFESAQPDTGGEMPGPPAQTTQSSPFRTATAPWAPGISGEAASPATLRLLAGLAWLGCGLMTGFLAFVQIGYAGTIVDDGSLTPLAAWNALMAALIIYGGVRLLSATKRSTFRQSAIWAVVIVLLQGFQIAQGATHFAYIGATIAAIAAGVLSYLTYQAIPETVIPAVADAAGTTPNAYRRGQARPAGERVLIVAIAVIAVVAVLLVYQSIRSGF